MNRKSCLSSWDMTYIVVGFIIGSSILYLSRTLVDINESDAWISAVIGSLYPIFILGTVLILSRKCPTENILDLSKRYFGKFFGNIFNIFFLIHFIIYLMSVIDSFVNLIRLYILQNANVYFLLLVFFILTIYFCSKDIINLALINKVAFYFMTVSIVFTIGAVRDGSILNILPIFSSSFSKIVKGAVNSAYSYEGMEIALLLYPYLKNKNDMAKSGAASILISTIIYTYTVFITIYYLGTDVIKKHMWPFVLTNTSIEFSVLNNFTYIFLMLWNIVALKVILDYSYASTFIFRSTFKCKKSYSFIFLAIVFICSLFLGNEVLRRDILSKIIPVVTIFDLLYSGVISIIVLFKEGDHM